MKTSKREIEARQRQAVRAFCTTPDVYRAAEASGASEREVTQIFTELCKKPFSESLAVFDVNKPFLAKKCQELLNNPNAKPADKITLMKLLLKTLGETVEDQSTTVNVNAPKALVMVGTSKKKIEAMLSPAPQLEDSPG